MVLYADEYQMLKFNRDASILELNWTNATSKLLDRTYMKRMDNVIYYMQRAKPQNLLANFESMIYMGRNYETEGINEEISTTMADAGVKKLALIRSKDMVTQLLVDQIVEAVDKNGLLMRYFDDEEIAKEWLNQPVN